MTDRQARKELEVFGIFASVCSLRIALDSIEKRCPPEPDILCALNGDGCVAFEMVQPIDEEKIARPLGAKETLDSYFQETYERLPMEVQGQVPKARIWISMRPSMSLSRRRSVVSKIIDQISLAGSRFEGNLVLPANLEGIAVRVGRGNRHRPLFDVKATTHYKAVPLDAISKKLEKSYDSSSPIELLAYYDIQGAPPDSELNRLYAFIDARLAKSCFRRIWVFDFSQRKVCYQTVLEETVVP